MDVPAPHEMLAMPALEHEFADELPFGLPVAAAELAQGNDGVAALAGAAAAGAAAITFHIERIVVAVEAIYRRPSARVQELLGVPSAPVLYTESMHPCAVGVVTVAPGSVHLMGLVRYTASVRFRTKLQPRFLSVQGLTIRPQVDVFNPGGPHSAPAWHRIAFPSALAVASPRGSPIVVGPTDAGALVRVEACVILPSAAPDMMLPMGERDNAVYRISFEVVEVGGGVVVAAPHDHAIFIWRGHTTARSRGGYPTPDCTPGTELTVEKMRERIAVGPWAGSHQRQAFIGWLDHIDAAADMADA